MDRDVRIRLLLAFRSHAGILAVVPAVSAAMMVFGVLTCARTAVPSVVATHLIAVLNAVQVVANIPDVATSLVAFMGVAAIIPRQRRVMNVGFLPAVFRDSGINAVIPVICARVFRVETGTYAAVTAAVLVLRVVVVVVALPVSDVLWHPLDIETLGRLR